MAKKLSFFSAGKLLITSEYGVIDGALALALPTKLGQTMTVVQHDKAEIHWVAKDADGQIWFEDQFKITDFSPKNSMGETALRLQQLFLLIRKMNPQFMSPEKGVVIETQLDFNRDWGLGSSSTLINNVAQWAGVNAYQLQSKIFGGSGYDIACAQKRSPITYQLVAHKPLVNEVVFKPGFHQNLHFIYINKKQNSRTAINEHYRGITDEKRNSLDAITKMLLEAERVSDFQKLMIVHESVISQMIGIPPIQETLFSDYKGVVKSLGAWGGDFVLACGPENSQEYFTQKGFPVVFSFADLILS
jgi:mevalonate kinase